MRRKASQLLIVLAVAGVLAPSVGEARRRRPVAREGMLQINSMTNGAKVLVDHEEVGVVPLPEPVKLAPGKHTLKMTKQGYTQFLEVFDITPGKTTLLDIDLLPVAGVFVIKSNVPDARVHIDGKFIGTAPLETEVLIGPRAIRVRSAGYYDFVLTRAAVAGQSQQIMVRLKPLPVGTTPYRPAPPPPPRWYEKWYVWAGVAGGVAAVALTVTLSVTAANRDEIASFSPQYHWKTAGLRF